MAYGSRNTRSLSFSSDGTMELVALELDEEIQLPCECGQCEKERKIWLDIPTDFQYASEFMARIKERYHLTSDLRLFFLSFYMAPTTPIFVMRMARGILKVMPGIGGDRTMSREPSDLQEDQQMNLADIEVEAGILHQRNIDENIQETMRVEELSPVIERVKRKRRAPTPYPSSPDSLFYELEIPKKKRRRRAVAATPRAKISKKSQQDGGKNDTKRSSQSSADPRAKKPVSYFRSPSKVPDENEAPVWSPDVTVGPVNRTSK